MTAQFGAPEKPFRLEETTIEELHAAIKSGQTTCVAIVQHYIDRVRAYNGVASALVTPDGAPIPEATGAVRAQAPCELRHVHLHAAEVRREAVRHECDRLRHRRTRAARAPTRMRKVAAIAFVRGG